MDIGSVVYLKKVFVKNSKENIIEVINLEVELENSSREKILKKICFDIKNKSITALVGKSGSGKSLTALSILGLIKYIDGLNVRGSISFEGIEKNILEMDDKELKDYRGNIASMIFQDPFTSFDPSKSCGEQIIEVLEFNRVSATENAENFILNLFTELGIERRLFFYYPYMLSGGQLQKISILATLVSNPRLIVADEPTTNLDAISKKEVLDFLLKVKNKYGISILYISHDLEAVRYISDEIVLLEAGKIKGSYKKNVFFEQPNVQNEKLVSKRKSQSDKSIIKSGNERKLLEVKNLTKTFLSRGKKIFSQNKLFRVLDKVSFEVMRGDVFGIIGESGSGKSTIARSILDLIPKDSGSVIFMGKSLDFAKANNYFYNDVQVVFQNPLSSLNPSLNVKSLLVEAIVANKRVNNSIESVNSKLKWLLSVVDLSKDVLSKKSRQLSGGEGQRVSIARALAVSPRLIVLDESISSLDKKMQYKILQLLLKLKNELNLTYIFITHDLEISRYFCNRILILQKGRVVEQGSVESVFVRPKHEYTKRLLNSILVSDS